MGAHTLIEIKFVLLIDTRECPGERTLKGAVVGTRSRGHPATHPGPCSRRSSVSGRRRARHRAAAPGHGRTQFNALPEGVKFLVDMRADLMRLGARERGLAGVERDLKDLLVSWFDIGFLELRRMTWEAPAHLLERLIAYEAVHESSWRHAPDAPRRFRATGGSPPATAPRAPCLLLRGPRTPHQVSKSACPGHLSRATL